MITNEVDIYEDLRKQVLNYVDENRLDPDTDEVLIDQAIFEIVQSHNDRSDVLNDNFQVNRDDTIERLKKSIYGYGPMHEILEREDIEEIFIEGSRVSYIDLSGYLKGLSIPTTEAENKHIVQRLLSNTDRTLTTKFPLVQARVLNGQARLTASIEPISDSLSATIRKYVVKNITLDDLVKRNALTEEACVLLKSLMKMRSRILISGEPGAGKTTLLSALLLASPPQQCIRCCEEIREIAVDFTHGGYYEVRPASSDGSGEITLRDLVKFTLAMRPDRIVCGEVRGAESFELSRAINAGCGFACTVHANNAADGLEALVNAALMAGENISESIMRNIFSSAIDIVIHVDRQESSGSILRGITEIIAVEPSIGNGFTTTTLFQRSRLEDELKVVGSIPSGLKERIDKVQGVLHE